MKDNKEQHGIILDAQEAKQAGEKLFEKLEAFDEMMMQYRCAIKEVATKFEVLNEEFSVRHSRNPVETIKTRLKTPRSILDKLARKELPLDAQTIRTHLFDIAGVRVITSFQDDIYLLYKTFIAQDDIRLLKLKDYIQTPKSTGYRSLHAIVEVPIFLSSQKCYVPVEVQFRTIAMDFWASLEHKLRYKKDVEDAKAIGSALLEVSEQICALDCTMQKIRTRIEKGGKV